MTDLSLWCFLLILPGTYEMDVRCNGNNISNLNSFAAIQEQQYEEIEIVSGRWDQRWSEDLVAHVKWRCNITFQDSVTFEADTLSGSFESLDLDSLKILSSHCLHISEKAFYTCTICHFEAKNLLSIPNRCFFYCTSLETFQAGTVTHLADSAFYRCENLRSITLGTVYHIGRYAFYMCSNLARFEDWSFDANTTIGDYAFDLCDSLTDVNMTNFSTIGQNAFSSCNNLKEIVIDGSATIGDSAFLYCESLEKVTAPNVEYVGERTFMFCMMLNSAELSKVTSLPGWCFCSCSKLEELTVPDLINAGKDCFACCYAFKEINFTFLEVDEYAFSYCCALETVKLNNASYIGYDCFAFSDNIRTVSFANLTNCSVGLFKGRSIQSFSAPLLTDIPDYCLSQCSALTHIDVSSCERIGCYAFEGVMWITALSLPNLISIGDYAFKDGVQFNFSEIGVLEYIGSHAFYGVTTLTFQYKNGLEELSVSEFSDNCFIGCNSIPRINFTCITKINGEFTCNISGTEIDMPNLESISGFPFQNDPSLTRLNLNRVSICEGGIARNCSSLKIIEMNNLTTISGTLLVDCPKVTKLEFINLNTCGNNSFANMSELVSIDITECTSIGSFAFYGCAKLTSVNGEKCGLRKVTTLGQSAFEGCAKLSTIDLSQMKYITDSCFKDCTALTFVNMSECDVIRGDCQFMGCTSLVRVDFRELDTLASATSARNMFYGCTKLNLLYLSDKAFSLNFDNDIFELTGANLDSIDICLKRKSEYSAIQEMLDSDKWRGLSLDPPDDYEEKCAAITKEKDYTTIIVVSVVSSAVVVAIVTGIVYQKVYLPMKRQRELESSYSEHLKLTRAIIDDFG